MAGGEGWRSGASAEVPLHTYRVRSSSRARQARISVTPHDGVVVIVPEGMDIDAASAVRERRAWIEQALNDCSDLRAIWLADPKDLLPSSITFALTGEAWTVEYRQTASASVRARSDGSRVVVSGAVTDAARCLVALQRWLQSRARERLLSLLAEEAAAIGATPAKCSVRGQRDRWAGCSQSGHITVNRALLFLPRDLVRAVIRHELAHLAHADHSRAFYEALEALDPHHREHARALQAARITIPGWAERRVTARAPNHVG